MEDATEPTGGDSRLDHRPGKSELDQSVVLDHAVTLERNAPQRPIQFAFVSGPSRRHVPSLRNARSLVCNVRNKSRKTGEQTAEALEA